MPRALLAAGPTGFAGGAPTTDLSGEAGRS
jgi:hypothetical protein